MPMNDKHNGAKAKRSPGRPAEFEREAAVLAAMNLFWRRGFEAVPVSDLADAMGITRSSFYNSFGDRESVFREALAAYWKAAPDVMLSALKPGQPVKEGLLALLREICRVRAADPDARGCLVVNSIGELAKVDEELGMSIDQTVHIAVRNYEKILRLAVRRGEIAKPDNLRAAARAIFAFVCGLNTISKVIRDEGELWRMCEVFLEGIGFGRTRQS